METLLDVFHGVSTAMFIGGAAAWAGFWFCAGCCLATRVCKPFRVDVDSMRVMVDCSKKKSGEVNDEREQREQSVY